MADEWEALNGLDSRDASDRYSDADQDGWPLKSSFKIELIAQDRPLRR